MQKVKRFIAWILALALLASPVVVLWQRQALFDWWRLRAYQAPSEVAVLASHDTMTDSAKRIFYVPHPEVDEKSTFSSNCTTSEKSIVLGCYVSGRERIYILSVNEAKLAGVEEVTAAHEMLHAAYERLSSSDRQNVNHLIEQAYKQLNDPRIKQTINEYRQNGDDTTNELHSILGTEVRQLPAELENYYRRYFDNRAQVVNYSDQYEAAFTALKDRLTSIQTELSSLKKQIEANQIELNSKQQTLGTERKRLDAELAAGHYDTYNKSVPGFNSQVQQYNAEITATQSLISRYNSLVDEAKAIVVQQQQLFQAIDSRSLPATQ